MDSFVKLMECDGGIGSKNFPALPVRGLTPDLDKKDHLVQIFLDVYTRKVGLSFSYFPRFEVFGNPDDCGSHPN